MPKVTKIPRKRDQRRRRVAAYCRVSTMLENQEESYEAQVSYYSAFIEANEEWAVSYTHLTLPTKLEV